MATQNDRRHLEILSKLIKSLRENRVQRGLSQNEIARRSGLSQATIARVEKGERVPTIVTLLQMTEAMGADLAQLIAEAAKGERS